MTDNKLPRMRTVRQAIKELKTIDPNTAISESTLRRWIKTNEIPYFNVGKRQLINLDLLFDKLMCYNVPDTNLCASLKEAHR